MDKFVVITLNSVYTVVSTATGNYVTGRATFDSRSVLPTDQLLSGKVKVDAEVGKRMAFEDPMLGLVTTSNVLMVIAL